jgi:hypothetical protein
MTTWEVGNWNQSIGTDEPMCISTEITSRRQISVTQMKTNCKSNREHKTESTKKTKSKTSWASDKCYNDPLNHSNHVLNFNCAQDLTLLLEEFKNQNRVLKERLEKIKLKQRKDRRMIRELEEHNVDINFDLAEAKKVSERLEKENSMLRRKASYAEEENERLQNQVANLMGVQGFEDILESDEVETPKPSSRSSQETRRSMWKTLQEEAVNDKHPPLLNHDSTSNILEKFFGNSSSSFLTFSESSILTGSSSSIDSKLTSKWDHYGSSHSAKTVQR